MSRSLANHLFQAFGVFLYLRYFWKVTGIQCGEPLHLEWYAKTWMERWIWRFVMSAIWGTGFICAFYSETDSRSLSISIAIWMFFSLILHFLRKWKEHNRLVHQEFLREEDSFWNYWRNR